MLDDYFLSLDERFFSRRYDAFWVRTVLDLMGLLGEETDADLDRLIGTLRGYYKGTGVSGAEIDDVPHEIVRLRGPGFWRDDAALGLKYRCLNAIASSAEKNDGDPDDWQYGILTALQLINLDQTKDEAIAARIQNGLAGIDGGEGTSG